MLRILIIVLFIMNTATPPTGVLSGEKVLIQNCHYNNLHGVRDCLSRGVDVNTVSEDGEWSGLTIAAEKNYPELLEILLSHPDIKINNTTESGRGINYHPLLHDRLHLHR